MQKYHQIIDQNLQNWLVVASRAPLEGLAVPSMSDIVYTVYTVYSNSQLSEQISKQVDKWTLEQVEK